MRPVKCYRTVSSDNYEPQQCIGKECSMHGSIGGLTGCLVAINHTVNIMESLERQTAKTEVVTEKTTEKTEDTNESKADSRTCNLLEGGADTTPQHDSNGSSSTV